MCGVVIMITLVGGFYIVGAFFKGVVGGGLWLFGWVWGSFVDAGGEGVMGAPLHVGRGSK